MSGSVNNSQGTGGGDQQERLEGVTSGTVSPWNVKNSHDDVKSQSPHEVDGPKGTSSIRDIRDGDGNIRNSKSKRIATHYVKFLSRAPGKVILACYLLVTGVCAYFGPQLISACTNSFKSPEGTESYQFESIVAHAFPDVAGVTQNVVVLETTDSTGITTDAMGIHLANFKKQLLDMKDADKVIAGGNQGLVDFWTMQAAGDNLFTTNLQHPFISDKPKYTSKDGLSTVTILLIITQESSLAEGFFEQVEVKLENMTQTYTHKNITASMTGETLFFHDIFASSEQDLLIIDAVSFPLALTVLAFILKSARLLIMPVLSIASAILMSYSIMLVVTMYMDVIAFAPSLMMSASIAMSIDYSLFLLTRYREELRNGATNTDAVITMVLTAGHTISVSGLTLAICFAGLMIFRIDLLLTCGMGSSIAILITLMVNLSITPAMLVTFPSFFEKCKESGPPACIRWCMVRCCCRLKWCKSCGNQHHYTNMRSDDCDDGDNNGNVGDEVQHGSQYCPTRQTGEIVNSSSDMKDVKEVQRRINQRQTHSRTRWQRLTTPDWKTRLPRRLMTESELRGRNSKWFTLSVLVSKGAWGIVALCIGVASVLAWQSAIFEVSNDVMMFAPRGFPSTEAWLKLADAFGGNRIHPVKLMVTAPAPTAVDGKYRNEEGNYDLYNESASSSLSLSSDFASSHRIDTNATFHMMHHIVENVLKPLNATNTLSFQGILYWGALYDYILHDQCPPPCPSVVDIYQAYLPFEDLNQTVRDAYMNADLGVSYLDITLENVNQFETAGVEFLDHMRELLKSESNDPTSLAYGYTFTIGGDGATSADVVQYVYKSFPIAIGVTCALVFLLIGIAFQSIVTPVRTILSIGVTVAMVYGMAKLVYNDDIFGALGFKGLSGHYLSWISPIMSFSICVGLSLDYEVFLLERILEFRKHGLGDKESIAMGVSMTGKIITAAGVIMAIAFVGLLFSGDAGLNQISFYMTLSVLVDTFIVRILFVPACMLLLGRVNWFPRKYKLLKTQNRTRSSMAAVELVDNDDDDDDDFLIHQEDDDDYQDGMYANNTSDNSGSLESSSVVRGGKEEHVESSINHVNYDDDDSYLIRDV